MLLAVGEDGIVLVDAQWLEANGPRVAGEQFVPRREISFVQIPDGRGRDLTDGDPRTERRPLRALIARVLRAPRGTITELPKRRATERTIVRIHDGRHIVIEEGDAIPVGATEVADPIEPVQPTPEEPV